MATTNINPRQFPRQKIHSSKKTEEWAEKCCEAAIEMTSVDFNENVRMSQARKQINYNLADGILDQMDISETVNPWGLEGTGVVNELQDFPLMRPRLNVLVGESAKRAFNPVARVKNDDAISEKEKMVKDTIMGKMVEMIQSQNLDEDSITAKLKGLEKWSRYEAQDLRERMATQVMDYLYRQQELKIKFMQGMEDALIAAEEIYCVDIVSNEPIVRKVSPLNLRTIRNGVSNKIEDADIIVEQGYQSLGYVIDTYYEYLDEKDIEYLEARDIPSDEKSTGAAPTLPLIPSSMFSTETDNDAGFSGMYLNSGKHPGDKLMAGFDADGNILVTRTVWRSMQKIGLLKYFDDNGELQETIVDEDYKPNLDAGEKVRWYWINEWWECTRLGDEQNGIYVKAQRRPIQFRRMDNLSAGGSGYVGTIYNIDQNEAVSLVDIMKPYQYLYDELMHRVREAFKKFKMPMIEVDLAKVPDGWDVPKWLYYAEQLGYIMTDSFKVGNEGAAKGKLAGHFNTSGKMYNPDMGNYIQQHIGMLQFIEKQLGVISGLPEQRLGQIDHKETVGGVERAVVQSSHITEKIFKLHENTMQRVLETLLETAKYAWRDNKSKKIHYVLDDLSNIVLNINGEQFNEAEYGIFVGESTNDTELLQNMRQLAHALIQNDKMNITSLMDIYLSPNVSSVRRKIEAAEQDAIEREEKAREDQIKVQQQQIEQMAADEEAKRNLEKEKSIRDSNTKIEVALINAEKSEGEQQVEDNSLDEKKLALQEEKQDEDKRLRERQLDEVIRHNKATEQIARSKPKPTPSKK